MFGCKYSVTRWTEQAKDCYKRGCVCNGCPVQVYANKDWVCRMKVAVLALVKKFGIPQDLVKDEKENTQNEG